MGVVTVEEFLRGVEEGKSYVGSRRFVPFALVVALISELLRWGQGGGEGRIACNPGLFWRGMVRLRPC